MSAGKNTGGDEVAIVAVEEALRYLQPMEPPAIAATLATQGVRGKRHHCGRCPLAVYLRRWAGRDMQVMASYVVMPLDRGGWQTFTLPESVAAFVAYFDGGQFRELRA